MNSSKFSMINIIPMPNSDGGFTVLVSHFQLVEINKSLIFMNKKRDYARKAYKPIENNATEKPNSKFPPPITLSPIYLKDGNCKLTLTEHEVSEIQTALIYVHNQRECARNYNRKNASKNIKNEPENYTNDTIISEIEEINPKIKPRITKLRIIGQT